MKRLKRVAAVVAGLALIAGTTTTGFLLGSAEAKYTSTIESHDYRPSSTFTAASDTLDEYYVNEIFPLVVGSELDTANAIFYSAMQPYSDFSWDTIPAYLSSAGFEYRDTLKNHPTQYEEEIEEKVANDMSANLVSYCEYMVPISELKNPTETMKKYKEKVSSEDNEKVRIETNKATGLPVTFSYDRNYLSSYLIVRGMDFTAEGNSTTFNSAINKMNTYCGIEPENLDNASDYVTEEFITRFNS